jgi:hypothetical protein
MTAFGWAWIGLAWGQAARIAGTPSTTCDFATVEDALAAAGPGDEIVVNNTALHTVAHELVVDHALTVSSGDGACATATSPAVLSGGFASRVFLVTPTGSLTLRDLTLLHGDVLGFPTGPTGADGGLVRVEAGGQLDASEVFLSYGSAVAGGCLSVAGEATLTGVDFGNCSALLGGAVAVGVDPGALTAGSLVATGGSLQGHANRGGALAVLVDPGLPRPSAALSGTRLTSSVASGATGFGWGGGAYVRGGDLELINAEVSANLATPTATGLGGGLFVDDDAFVRVSGGSVQLNEAALGGGAYVRGTGALELDDGCVGCWFVDDLDPSTIVPAGNVAQVGGGVAVVEGGTLELTSSAVIAGNLAGSTGGGVDVSGSGSSVLVGGFSAIGIHLTREAAPPIGRMEACGAGSLGNSAQEGGGVAVRDGASFTVRSWGRRYSTEREDRSAPLRGVRLSCNQAQVGGGLLVDGATSQADLRQAVVVGNVGTGGGAGLHVRAGADA